MLIHPWDSSVDTGEWQTWLKASGRFGILVVNNADPTDAPVAVPTHFTVAEDQIVLHLARPNPIWHHLAVRAAVRLVVTGDDAYVPSYWRAKPAADPGEGVPTSYYSSVQFVCAAEVVDDPAEKAEILATQLADLQPEGGHGVIAADRGPYARMLSGIRGLRLTIQRVDAKFKFDDHREADLRAQVADKLDERDSLRDQSAAREQRRRLAYELHGRST